jgi:hypothetical protein
MRNMLMSAAVTAALVMAGSSAKAQVNLSEYADGEGFLGIQTLTCAQPAGTWQDQADLLSSWYSGWYNGLAKTAVFRTNSRLESCRSNSPRDLPWR